MYVPDCTQVLMMLPSFDIFTHFGLLSETSVSEPGSLRIIKNEIHNIHMECAFFVSDVQY